MKAVRKITILLLFSACLGVGFWGGWSILPGRASARLNNTYQPLSTADPRYTQAALPSPELLNRRIIPTPTPEPTAAVQTEQHNLLIVVADSLVETEPQLQGVWLALVISGQSKIMLLPVDPDPGESSEQPRRTALPAQVPLAPDGALDPRFFEALWERNLNWEAYLLVDETGLAGLWRVVSMQGGEESMPGQPGSLANVDSKTSEQNLLIQTLCQSASRRIPASLEPVLDLTPQHLRTDIDLHTLSRNWPDLLTGYAGFTCEFPALAAGIEP